MVPVSINNLAVLVAAIAGMVIGSLWYSPLLFGNMWIKLLGWKESEIKSKSKGVAGSMGVMFIGTLVSAYVFAHLVEYLSLHTAWEGIQTAFWLWVGFVVPVCISAVLFEGKPWKLFFINVFYYLVSFATMGAILSVWM